MDKRTQSNISLDRVIFEISTFNHVNSGTMFWSYEIPTVTEPILVPNLNEHQNIESIS